MPAEAFTKRQQDVSFLHIFGATCWAKKSISGGHLVDGGSKLADRSKKCVFLGYTGSNYHVLDQAGCVFVSCDIIFDEGPVHHSVSVGETETEVPLTTQGPTMAPDTPVLATPPATPQALLEPVLRCSSRLACPGADAIESSLSKQCEAEARNRGDDWATNGRRPRALMGHGCVRNPT